MTRSTNAAEKTVWLIGAGLSMASEKKLPTMSGFFGIECGNTNLDKFLASFYRGAPRTKYNLEEVLSYVSLGARRLRLWKGPSAEGVGQYEHLYEEVIALIKQKLDIPPRFVCSLHRSITSTLKSTDSVISLNYDLLMDEALRESDIRGDRSNVPDPKSRTGKLNSLLGRPTFIGGDPPSLTDWEMAEGFYLKLHGSLDWIQCPNMECGNHSNIYALIAQASPHIYPEGSPCRSCGSAMRVLIVPPVATKRLADTGRLALLWNLALQELMVARRIVVVGLSFAPSDFELRWLTRQSRLLVPSEPYELAIVNPCEKAREATRDVFPGDHASISEFSSTEEYLQSLG
jgi:hypothetical protein